MERKTSAKANADLAAAYASVISHTLTYDYSDVQLRQLVEILMPRLEEAVKDLKTDVAHK